MFECFAFLKPSETHDESDHESGGIFVCGQTTATVHECLRELMEVGNTDVRVSAPPFNVKNHPQLQSSRDYNIPCFGLIPSAALSVLNSEMREDAPSLSMKVPSFTIDRFVQGKMKKVHQMVKNCKEVITDSNEAFDRVDRFAKDFSELDPSSIQSTERWFSFVKKYITDPDWQNKTHYDHILGLFGFTEEAAVRIREKTLTEEDKDGKLETSTYEHFGVRWLAKALTGFKPDGVLTDVVNLIYAMMGEPPTEAQTEKDVIEKIETFKKNLSKSSDMWIPDVLLHDAESDDMMVWLLLRYIHKQRGSQLKVHVQLPIDTRLDEKAQDWSTSAGVKVFRDPDSKNLEALLNYHTK